MAAFTVWHFRPEPLSGRPHSPAHFVPVKDNGKLIRVQGWKDDELKKITTDFAKLYGVSPVFDIAPLREDTSVLQLTFPGDIESTLFLYLVNYIKYPKDLPERADIEVAGRTVLSADFRLPDESLVGRQAWIYVPAGDTTYDVVYVRLDSGETYADSFNAPDWKRTDDPRLPKALEALAR